MADEVTTDRGNKLSGLDNPAVFDDGETVAFTINTDTGEHLRVHCPIAELGQLFAYLGHLAKIAGAMRDAPKPTTLQEGYNDLVPIPADGFGFQAGSNPDETLLMVRLSGFDMAFAAPSSALARMADEFVRIARTLSAGGNQRQ